MTTSLSRQRRANGIAKRVIRPLTVGRKNWLFHGNEASVKLGEDPSSQALTHSKAPLQAPTRVTAYDWSAPSISPHPCAHPIASTDPPRLSALSAVNLLQFRPTRKGARGMGPQWHGFPDDAPVHRRGRESWDACKVHQTAG
jgi:hypothetical protein